MTNNKGSAVAGSVADMQNLLLEAVTSAKPVTVEELRETMANEGGDLELPSRLAVFLIAQVERALGAEKLASVSDLDRDVRPSVQSLSELLFDRWREHQGGTR